MGMMLLGLFVGTIVLGSTVTERLGNADSFSGGKLTPLGVPVDGCEEGASNGGPKGNDVGRASPRVSDSSSSPSSVDGYVVGTRGSLDGDNDGSGLLDIATGDVERGC